MANSTQGRLGKVHSDEPLGTDFTSSIRPRNRKTPLSSAQEVDATFGSATATSTPGSSRCVSPMPTRHLNRPSSRGAVDPVQDRSRTASASRGATTSILGSGFRESSWGVGWSRLQGLANTVLGVDLNGDGVEGYASDGGLARTRSRSGADKKLQGFWPKSGAWGIPEQSTKDVSIGSGTTAEREAAVRSKKMARILESRDIETGALDMNGNMKRRTSVEEARTELDVEDDALVYIHPVQPNDTLVGVMLKYNCQPAVFRKANRFWPNDSIQIRKVVMLPVDACQVRGKPCEPPENTKLGVPSCTSPGTGRDASSPFSEDHILLSTSDISTNLDDEKTWTHVRWVLLDGSADTTPIEVGRMPRRTLGYFPPRRRKSHSTLSAKSTPRPSLDWSRSPPTNSHSLDLAVNQPYVSPRIGLSGSAPSHSRQSSYFSHNDRRESFTEAADRLGWIKGPGGVGSLSKSVRRPGPAKDAFNTWANKHVPGIAIDSLPSTSILDAEGVSYGFKDGVNKITEGRYSNLVSGTYMPSEDSNQGKGLENAAAAVEGWFRRLAANAPSTPRLSSSNRTDSSDLIEMLDGTGSDDGKGFEPSPGIRRSTFNGPSGREDLDSMLRGRDKAGVKAKKSD